MLTRRKRVFARRHDVQLLLNRLQPSFDPTRGVRRVGNRTQAACRCRVDRAIPRSTTASRTAVTTARTTRRTAATTLIRRVVRRLLTTAAAVRRVARRIRGRLIICPHVSGVTREVRPVTRVVRCVIGSLHADHRTERGIAGPRDHSRLTRRGESHSDGTRQQQCKSG